MGLAQRLLEPYIRRVAARSMRHARLLERERRKREVWVSLSSMG